jgi:predicted nicotinamide N-methyase
MSDDENDDCYGAIGFMFDAQHSKITEKIQIGSHSILVKIIGDDPGHVQSGQYLWPAAKYLGEYLVENWTNEHRSVVVELGSGAGLSGIAAALMGGASSRIFLTDYDPGCIEILEDNIVLNNCGSYAEAVSMEWGRALPESIRRALESVGQDNLLIASDVIYSASVVAPLFQSVLAILRFGGTFLLASSFDYGEVCTPTNTRLARLILLMLCEYTLFLYVVD